MYSIFLTQYFPNLLNHEAEPMFSEHVRKPLARWTRHEKAYIKKIMTLYFYNGQNCLTRTSSLCLLLINYMVLCCCFFLRPTKCTHCCSTYPFPAEWSSQPRTGWPLRVISSQGVKLSLVISKFNGMGSSITSECFSLGDRSPPFFS